MSKHFTRTLLVILLIVLCAGIGLLYSVLNISTQDSLYLERKIALDEMTKQMTSSISTTIKDAWWQCQFLEKLINETKIEEQNTLDSAKYIGNMISREHSLFGLYDSRGHCFMSNGWIGRSSQMKRIVSTQKQQLYIAPFLLDGKETDFCIFMSKLDTPRQISYQGENRTITHFALGLTVDFILSRFISGFEHKINTFILDESGLMHYKGYDLGVLIEGSNYFTKLRKNVFFPHGESVEDIISGTLKGDVHCHEAYITEGGMRSFTCMKSIDGTEWILACTIPTRLLSAGVSSHLKHLIFYVSVLFLLFGLGLILSVIIFQKSQINKKLLQKENDLNQHLQTVAAQQEILLRKEQEANTMLEEAATKAKEASEAKTVFLSNMSHDIRTPINGIMGMAHIAMKEQMSVKAQECLDKITHPSDHLLSLVNDVLDLTRIESGKTTPTFAPMNLKELLGNCVSIIQGQIGIRDLNLIADFDHLNHCFVIGDSLHLR